MTAIFAPEITTIDAQLAALQAQIAAIQEQRAAITKAESVAAGIVQAVRGGVEEFQQIAGISDDAIARVKRAVLDIFGGNPDNGNDGNGNLPLEPAPQPNDDGNCEVTSQPNQEISSDELSAQITESLMGAIAVAEPQPEDLTGQYCEWASPLASPLSSWLCCQMEDAPQSVLAGQAVEIAQVAFSRDGFKYINLADEPTPKTIDVNHGTQVIHTADGSVKFHLNWNRRSSRVATYSSPENPYNWEHGFVSYLGFATKEVASAWQQHLLKIGAASKCIIRKVNRLKVDCPKGVRIRWEMKCHGLSASQLQNIVGSDLTQPPACIDMVAEAASDAEITAVDLELIKFQSGDRIKVIEPGHRDHGEFGTVKRLVMADGVVAVGLDSSPIERLYPPHFIKLLEVEDLDALVPDEPALVRDISTDWKARAKELNVSIDNISPGHYLAYHKYRKLGEIIEKHDADSPYYVNRNQRTMLSVGNGDGQQYSNPYECAIGLAKFLKVIVEPEVAKADLFGGYSEPFPAPQASQTWRDIETEQQKQVDVVSPDEQIEANDWVELLVTGDRYQVAEVDNEGIHLVTDDGNMLVQPDEIQLLMKIPANWQPFQAPANWQPF